MVSELSQSQNVVYCTIQFLWYSQKDICSDREQIIGCQSLEVGVGYYYKRVARGRFWESQSSSCNLCKHYLAAVVFTQIYKIHRAIPPKRQFYCMLISKIKWN